MYNADATDMAIMLTEVLRGVEDVDHARIEINRYEVIVFPDRNDEATYTYYDRKGFDSMLKCAIVGHALVGDR